MEIDITRFVHEACPRDYSASVAEIGNNAGADTWRAALDDAEDYPFLDSDDAREAFREYVRGLGAWDKGEIAAWSDRELSALFLQWVAGGMREAGITAEMTADDWARVERDAESGRISGNIYPGDDGRVFFYVGS